MKNSIPEKEEQKIAANAEKVTEKKSEETKVTNEQPTETQGKKDKKKKKKHNSALTAAAKGGSALSQVDAHSYKDGNYANTGSNLSYRDDQ